ncbi:Alpha/Beta hydrolase protein [Zychaea mexicana]|uniref:Alpha/Beta hydrolase protein n=1 Tax=Zychaea mexicana TaxID=64656 RepID=UPI0022FDDB00|nr:Alpha/Beta hydrolase protein [Zychaea mexicana]KAI9488724.1 Alpha/Beta hydrolase protein [Zychaea mexicana]
MMTIDPPSPKQATTAATGGRRESFSKQHPMRNDPKLGNDNLIAFIRNRDIWVVTPDGYEVQLTTCSLQTEDPTLSCGTVEYIMQEEFQRYAGYYWGPPDRSMNRILYLETSEEQVEVVLITKPAPGIQSSPSSSSSSFHTDSRSGSPVRYPRAGRSNAISDMQMVYFDAVKPGHPTTVIRKRLWGGSLNERYPWAEYIVRFGWLPDGQSVWAQILSRDQQRTIVLYIKCDQFVSEEEYRRDPKPTHFEVLWEEYSDVWINVSDGYYFLQQPSMDDCTEFIWSSEMSGFRHLYFVRRRKNRSPKNNSNCNGSNRLLEKEEEKEEENLVQQLTYGDDWGLTDQSIDVDERRKLVYFKAKKDTPLETHFYAVSYQQQQSAYTSNIEYSPIVRLTELGFSHNVTIDTNADAFIDCFSSLHHTPCIVIRRIDYHCHSSDDDSDDDFILPAVSETRATLLIPLARCGNEETDPSNADGSTAAAATATSGGSGGGAMAGSFEDSSSLKRLSIAQQSLVYVSPTLLESSNTSSNDNLQYCKSDGIEYLHDTMKSSTIESFDAETQTVPAGEIFNFVNQDGVRLYGYLYKPRLYQPGASYPTILYIYGGPKTQMVINDFRLPRLQRYLMSVYFGFAVVVIDGRGSSDRGIQFEAHLKHRLGSVEMDDQIAGLQHICDAKIGAEATSDGTLVSVVDINRVAINGWSYGGYLSLMGLAQRPDIFKIAIAGAPVTQWELYDSAYTERYMGMPMTNPAGYQSGSVVNRAKQFPDGEHRLLIAHGLIDENVHFTNTEMLVSKLVKHNKPHYLQVYPTERHGLRHASVNEHFETLMFFWLINYL